MLTSRSPAHLLGALALLGGLALAPRSEAQCATPPRPVPVSPLPTNPGASSPGTAGLGLPALPGQSCATPVARTPEPSAAAEDTSWSTWWSLNEDLLLDLRAQERRPNGPYREGFYIGRGQRDQDDGDDPLPSPREVEDGVVPLLLDALERERSNVIQREALLAVARAGRACSAERASGILAALQARLSDSDRAVSEAAILALGVLGRTEAIPALTGLLQDARAGRELLGGDRVDPRRRAFAAYALGLLGAGTSNEDVRRHLVHHLVRALDGEAAQGTPDLEVACLLAVARMPLGDDGGALAEARVPSASRAGQVRLFLDVFQSRFRERLSRAHAAASLGRLLEDLPPARRDELKGAVVPALLAVLREGATEPREVVQSVVLALGELGDDDGDALDRDLREALRGIGAVESDRTARHFALVSLARVSVRPGSGSRADAVQRARGRFLAELADGDADGRPWASLALGLQGRALVERGAAPSREISLAVRTALGGASTPLETSGHCLALGLLGDPGSASALLEVFAESGHDEVRGYAALALGLLGEHRAVDPITRSLAAADQRPVLLERLGLALVLLGRPNAVVRLSERLAASRSLDGRGALLSALGRVGDRRAIAVLEKTATRRSVPAETRAGAFAALGRLAEPDRFPWASAYVPGTNYQARTDTLFAPGGGGLLNAR